MFFFENTNMCLSVRLTCLDPEPTLTTSLFELAENFTADNISWQQARLMQFQIPDCFFEAWQHNWCNLGQWRWQPEITHILWSQLCLSFWRCGILVKMLLSTWKPLKATSPWPSPANSVYPVPLIPIPRSLRHLLQKWSHTTVAQLKGRRIASALPCTRQPSLRKLLL